MISLADRRAVGGGAILDSTIHRAIPRPRDGYQQCWQWREQGGRAGQAKTYLVESGVADYHADVFVVSSSTTCLHRIDEVFRRILHS
jgi:hypothetical protein